MRLGKGGLLALGALALGAAFLGGSSAKGAAGAGAGDCLEPSMTPEIRREVTALLGEKHSDLELEIAAAMLEDAGFKKSAACIRARKREPTKKARIRLPESFNL